MPKGYVISRVDIIDPEAYARYAAAATKAIAAHGGKALARGGRHEALEGKARARNVVLEFDSYEAARAYFYSAEYQAARALRRGRGRNRNGAGGRRLTRRATGVIGMADLRIVVTGAAGRMGRMVVRAIHEADGHDARRRARARGLALARPRSRARSPAVRRAGSRSSPIRCRCC